MTFRVMTVYCRYRLRLLKDCALLTFIQLYMNGSPSIVQAIMNEHQMKRCKQQQVDQQSTVVQHLEQATGYCLC